MVPLSMTLSDLTDFKVAIFFEVEYRKNDMS